jgi:acyl-coenzyme A thioesterase PaaI-like protein
LTFLSEDWQEAHLRLGLSLRTRNYVGTIFGGAMFAATDPLYMVMLIKILGPDYVVWDKAGKVRFIRPGKERLRARFELSPTDIAAIRDDVTEKGAIDRIYTITWLDHADRPVARIEKTVYIADKAYHQQRQVRRSR